MGLAVAVLFWLLLMGLFAAPAYTDEVPGDPDLVLHTALTSPACTSCHGTDTRSIHANCDQCHASPRLGEITGWSIECATCHTYTRSDGLDHAGFTAKHTPLASAECYPCHPHGESTTVELVTDFHANCAMCHNDTIVTEGITVDCTNCHGTAPGTVPYHANFVIAHDATSTASLECAGCHESADISVVHADRSEGCKLCHVPTYATCNVCHRIHGGVLSGPPPAECANEGCHGTLTPATHYIEASHTALFAPGEDCADCHSASLKTEHEKSSAGPVTCVQCHEDAVDGLTGPWNGSCSACHGTPHGGMAAKHQGAVTRAWVPIFIDHDGYGPPGLTVDCSMCHASRDLAQLHSDECALCHAGSGPPAWEGDCTACHTSIHSAADTAHSGVAMTGCEQCHQPDWSVPEATCATCHSITETVAPVTGSNLKPTYIGAAPIRLTPTDALPSSGLDGTFYVLDGGTRVSGLATTVPGPVSGTQSHSIEYWSQDNAGNVEVHKLAAFTVTADTVPPVTTANAKPIYYADAAITLMPLDNGSIPVRGTYYSLDGGPTQAGNRLTVPRPASGSAAHTLVFWSVDGSGNEELPHKSVNFTIVADTTPPVTQSNAPLYWSSTQPTFVRFTASDPVPGSGVAATFYRLAGGSIREANVLYVYGSGAFNIEWWSVDKAGNIETHKNRTLIRDALKPTTTSNAVPSYVGSAVITLSAIDAGMAGVATTYYTVDGGTATAGNTVTVTAVGAHVLRFWSVDRAGNTELQKTANFAITAP